MPNPCSPALPLVCSTPLAFGATGSSYLERRAAAAIELAQRATCPAAVKAHYVMASAYLARLYPEPDCEQAQAA